MMLMLPEKPNIRLSVLIICRLFHEENIMLNTYATNWNFFCSLKVKEFKEYLIANSEAVFLKDNCSPYMMFFYLKTVSFMGTKKQKRPIVTLPN